MYTADDFRTLLSNLLPTGKLWVAKDQPNSVFYRLLTGFSIQPASIANLAIKLANQLNPLFADELLERWETELKLPEACLVLTPQTILQRQQTCYDKYTSRFLPTLENLEAMVVRYGYDDVTITEYNEGLRAEAECEQVCFSQTWALALLVSSPDIQVNHYFSAGDECENYLAQWANTDELKCLLDHYRPAHTIVVMNYEIAE
jgi:uncharacterized protein YmfQ (DUF2313 family)